MVIIQDSFYILFIVSLSLTSCNIEVNDNDSPKYKDDLERYLAKDPGEILRIYKIEFEKEYNKYRKVYTYDLKACFENSNDSILNMFHHKWMIDLNYKIATHQNDLWQRTYTSALGWKKCLHLNHYPPSFKNVKMPKIIKGNIKSFIYELYIYKGQYDKNRYLISRDTFYNF